MSWTEQYANTSTWIEHDEHSSWGFVNYTYGSNPEGDTIFTLPFDNATDYNESGSVDVSDAVYYGLNKITTSHIPDNRTWGNAYDSTIGHYQPSITWTERVDPLEEPSWTEESEVSSPTWTSQSPEETITWTEES